MTRAFSMALLLMTFAVTGYGEGFYSVHSPNGVDVWGVGKAGNVFRSLDGGITWRNVSQGSADYRSVYTLGTHVWVVGSGGAYRHSADNGETWTSGILNGGVTLNSLAFTDASTGWAAGIGGTMLHTTDGGATWQPQTSGTGETINKLAFVDANTGFAVGNNGVLLRTTNGGLSWAAVTGPSWNADILSVAARGTMLVVVGRDGMTSVSADGGGQWTSKNYKTDSSVDVYDVSIRSAGEVVYVGGGGFIAKAVDGVPPYTWGIHQMHARLNAVYFHDALRGWACSERNNAILRTTDGGDTWLLPQGTTVSYAWSQKLSASNSTGSTFCINPLNKERIYVALGGTVYMSVNLGETWTATASIPSTLVSSFYISPEDTTMWLAAINRNQVVKSTNRGASWVTTLNRNYTTYGMPMELDPNNPRHVLFAEERPSTSNAVIFSSDNFGSSWDTLVQTGFRSPCDIVIVPDLPNVIYVGDGVTGSGNAQMWRSTNGGLSWSSIYTVSGSEIPMISISRLRNTFAYATAWGSGGFWKTTNTGAQWGAIASTGSTWGTDIAKDDPNVVMYGVYGGQTSYLSTNAGAQFTASSLSGSNSAFLCYDRATFLAQQTSGVYKYNITYTVPTVSGAAIALVSPNGGEQWAYNTTQAITWTAVGVSAVKIDYKTAPASPWQTIAASVPASDGSYQWTVPNTPTPTARVRISDASTGAPVDSSDGYFAITVAGITTQPVLLNFGLVPVGTARVDTIRITNSGNGTLVVSSVATSNPAFTVGRTSFTIPAGASDTLSVVFVPSAMQTYSDTLVMLSNAPTSPTLVALTGIGDDPSSVQDEGLPLTYALDQNYPNPFNPATMITYSLPEQVHVVLRVYTALGEEVATLVNQVQPLGRYSVSFSGVSPTGGQLASGIYFYRLHAGEFVAMRKMIILK